MFRPFQYHYQHVKQLTMLTDLHVQRHRYSIICANNITPQYTIYARFKLSNNKLSVTDTSFFLICQNQRLQLQKITTTKMIFLQFQESSRNPKSTFESLKEIQRTTKDSLDSYTKAGANTN